MNAGELPLRPGDHHPEIHVVTGNPDSGLVRALRHPADEEASWNGHRHWDHRCRPHIPRPPVG